MWFSVVFFRIVLVWDLLIALYHAPPRSCILASEPISPTGNSRDWHGVKSHVRLNTVTIDWFSSEFPQLVRNLDFFASLFLPQYGQFHCFSSAGTAPNPCAYNPPSVVILPNVVSIIFLLRCNSIAKNSANAWLTCGMHAGYYDFISGCL